MFLRTDPLVPGERQKKVVCTSVSRDESYVASNSLFFRGAARTVACKAIDSRE